MPVGKKQSPFKYVPPMAVTAGLGIASGLGQIIGGMAGSRKRKAEQRKAQAQYNTQTKAYSNLDTSNLYADVQNQFTGLQNTFEDLTVNQQQAQFEAQQNMQSQANILQSLRASAGGSGVAGLAQAMANQSQIAAQRASASIGMQEAQNQRLSAQQAARIQQLERQGAQFAEQQRLMGATQARAAETVKTENLLSMAAGRLDAAKQARADARAQIAGGIGSLAVGGLQAFGAGGGFTKDVGEEFLADGVTKNPAFIKGGFNINNLFPFLKK